MTRRPRLAIYAHHLGAGHRTRASAVAARWPGPVTVLSSDPGTTPAGVERVVLPLDDAPVGTATPPTLHHAPAGHVGLRRRMARIAGWVDEHEPSVALVDVSVEVTLLLRLLGVPTGVVRQPGDRDDPAHTLAFRTADLVLAPWGSPGHGPTDAVHVGLLSRFDGLARPAARSSSGLDRVVVVAGSGGRGVPVTVAQRLGEELRDTGARVEVIGTTTPRAREAAPDRTPPTVRLVGQVEDVFERLCAADVAVIPASLNLVAEAAAAGTPVVVVPEDRPHHEQRRHAALLGEQHGVPVAEDWHDERLSALVRAAHRLRSTVPSDGLAAVRAVEALLGLARASQIATAS